MAALSWARRSVGVLSRCALLLLAIPLLGASNNARVDRLVTNFDLIIFNTEFGTPMDAKIHKWVTSIRIFLDARAGPLDLERRQLEEHVALLRRLTGLKIDLVPKASDANLMFVFDTADRLIGSVNRYLDPPLGSWKDLHGSTCFGMFAVKGAQAIGYAVIGIPIDIVMSQGILQACVIEETTQVLGLPNDSDKVYPSVFNDHSPQVTLTDDDEMLVRLLYSPRLQPGMARPEALKIVRQILEEGGP
ncbi:hypothetical protein FRZ61_24770 [Hypericibacter adhaerens]|jgi:hypothetical protein|uniref:DUF2927 domain-containing protein n=1 Tax=Hypericibacter adhaerens TaxID=2602016 RepID=A0A5J6N0R6_9PROT|nr:DUF2927 domain-containing protein [Hypericibacter adhaerens]QEX22545.1 hypothetical protein FRZ61_24770 [Hypericibacter adhaerens]